MCICNQLFIVTVLLYIVKPAPCEMLTSSLLLLSFVSLLFNCYIALFCIIVCSLSVVCLCSEGIGAHSASLYLFKGSIYSVCFLPFLTLREPIDLVRYFNRLWAQSLLNIVLSYYSQSILKFVVLR